MIRNPILVRGMFRSSEVELSELAHRAELSSFMDVSQLLTKSLLLTCVSFYEGEVVGIVRRTVEDGDHRVPMRKWILNAAVERKFFGWFRFNENNTNQFLGGFGREFLRDMRALIDRRSWRRKAEVDFLDLCRRRNECVHSNYGAYSLDLTMEEIRLKHCSAMGYIRLVEYGAARWLAG